MESISLLLQLQSLFVVDGWISHRLTNLNEHVIDS